MTPMEINGGRFYVRPLHDDNRIDDRPALEQIDLPEALAGLTPASARKSWEADTRYIWAACEQTSVHMVALVVLNLEASPASIQAFCVGDPDRVLPNDPVLVPKTVADGAHEGAATVERWAKGFLGLEELENQA
ncbi:hypothetical protein [Corynebacterium gerontici]|uniref:Uncharacterized protein n=1 Tax=Corynebacterium gerontici TaxID=2079234 RepID=A0A3G6IYH3_9CORY|nr:hypothetical protein [Corynebacterium gerontici]AZA10829.1 hypothetical protein CGERO_02525 [Corynebacterium gerontici]